MAITRVAHGTVSKAGNAANASPGAPASPATGDLWFCFVGIGGGGDVNPATMDAAWTSGFSVAVSNGRYQMFQFPYTGSTPTLTVTNHAAGPAMAFIVGYRPSSGGVLSVDGTPATQVTGSTTINYPTATPSRANDMCVLAWMAQLSGTNGAISGTDPTPTEELDDTDATGLTSLGYADGLRTASTATGARTSTFSANSSNCGATILLTEVSPAAAVSGTGASGMTEADVVAGGKTLILTLTDTNWIPA